MKSKGLLLSALFASALAQAQHTTYSNGFEEPEGLGIKVVQCANGNTFLFNFTKKDGIETMLFNKDHQLAKQHTVAGEQWTPRAMIDSRVDGIYEINGKLELFLEQADERKPKLYRFEFDPATGAMTKVSKIAEMSAYGGGAGYAMLFGHVDPKTFYVEKDPSSDHYAVISYDGFANETQHRIEAAVYDGDNKEISRAFYDSPENSRYKYVKYIASAVKGESLYICTYVYNTKATGDKTSQVFFYSLGKGEKQMEHKGLSITEDFKNTTGILAYNEGTHLMNLLTLSLLESRGNTTYYAIYFAGINPETMVVAAMKSLDGSLIDAYRTKAGGKGKFSGMPQNMIINPDHSITVVLEETVTTTIYRGTGTQSSTHLGGIGILELDENGNPKKGFWVPKSQEVRWEIPSLWQHMRYKNYQKFERQPGLGGYANQGFYSFNYISTPNARYVMFNDHPKNFEDRDRLGTLSGISDAQTAVYTFNDARMDRSYFYGTPPNKRDNRFSYISSGNYLEQNHTYAELIVDNFGSKKTAKVAWTTFE